MKLSKRTITIDFNQSKSRKAIKKFINDEFQALDEDWITEFGYDEIELRFPFMSTEELERMLLDFGAESDSFAIKQINAETIRLKIWD